MDANFFSDLKLEPDIVLLDPPCSGSGVVRKDPSAKKRINKKHIQKYVDIQKQLIDNICPHMKPGSTLIYSTCTVAPEENEFQVKYMVENHNMKLEPLKLKLYSPAFSGVFGEHIGDDFKLCGRLWPHVHDTTGFFVAKIRKP
jgi:16S rRNA C967 or C1407 C5-methylase (RsmB/RsmF family)